MTQAHINVVCSLVSQQEVWDSSQQTIGCWSHFEIGWLGTCRFRGAKHSCHPIPCSIRHSNYKLYQTK